MAYGEGGVDGEGRRGVARAMVATAAVISGEGGGFGRRDSADFAGGGGMRRKGGGTSRKRGRRGRRIYIGVGAAPVLGKGRPAP